MTFALQPPQPKREDTADEEVGHCPVLDRAGAGRLLAGIGTVLSQYPGEDDEEEL